MRYKKDPDRLYFFITLSVIIHLLIFIVFPYGNLNVLGNSDDTQEYDFMQLVEYKVLDSQANSQNNVQPSNTVDNTKIDDSVKKDIEEIKKENQKNENKITEPEELDKKEELDNKEKEDLKPNSNNKPTEVEKSNTLVDTEPEKKDIMNNETSQNDSLRNNTSGEEDSTDDGNVENKISSETNNDIISSENSDLQIEVNDSSTDSKSDSNQDIEANTNKENIRNEQEKVNEMEEDTPPPPPPSAGEMLLGHPKPAYPKDLYGEAPSGEVHIQVHVSSSGEIETLQVIKASGFEEMDRIAKLTVERGWTFRSYQQSYSLIIKVEFMLDEDGNDNVRVSQGNLVFK